MLPGWIALLCALGYLCLLFTVAHIGDARGKALMASRARPAIFALALAVYCTSWTFLGSVGLASRAGLDFLPIYIGPILVYAFGWPLITRVASVARAQKSTSVADFIAARYGKSQSVAALVTLIAVVGVLPYIGLQLKAVSASIEIILFRSESGLRSIPEVPFLGDLSLLVALVLAAFAIAFGTRHVDATEHQDGLVLAIAMESLVKLVSFLIVGVFVVFLLNGASGHLSPAMIGPAAERLFSARPDPVTWGVTTLIAGFAALLLPRQFHMAVVENRDPRDIRRAAWMFPLYLVAINIFVLPIAIAGLALFPDGAIDRDLTVLAIPLETGAGLAVVLAFIGALSAATAMVIVETVALAIMVSNDLVVPTLIRRPIGGDESSAPNMREAVLVVRRVTIVAIIALAYAYFRLSSEAALASIGLLSFAAIAQLGPAFFVGLYWKRANGRGAVLGLAAGFVVWAYMLFLPTLATWSEPLALWLREGWFGLVFGHETTAYLTNPPNLVDGVAVSLTVNLAMVVLGSFLRAETAVEKLQAEAYVGTEDSHASATPFRLFRTTVSVSELRQTVARYLGEDRAQAAFAAFERERGGPYHAHQAADAHLLRHAEHLLAAAIGAASARLVLSLQLRQRTVSTEAALKLLDDASSAIQYSRDILQHALDHTDQGVTVFDRNLRLVGWNRAFVKLFAFPPDFLQFGLGLDEIVTFNARRGTYGDAPPGDIVAARMDSFVHDRLPNRLKLYPSGIVLEIRANPLPDGGIVTTYADVTEAVTAEDALEAANLTLEQRVRERTEELVQLNHELSRAKRAADEANVSKTRFLAAASHDILQPLNAARLYASTLRERIEGQPPATIAADLESSLDAVEEILGALLEMSKLDSGKLKPEIGTFSLDEIFQQLQVEFAPLAKEKRLALTFLRTTLAVKSDRRLLRRALQNLIANALKYTPAGRVLVGCQRRGGAVKICVFDTGPGIPPSKQKAIFQEFQRLEEGMRAASGIGLGLSIVDRIARVLGHTIALRSNLGRGSCFSLAVPRALTPAPAAALPTATPAPRPPTAFAALRVLVVDNEAEILSGMRLLLENWGCSVQTAPSLADAETVIVSQGFAPEVLLVDYHLGANPVAANEPGGDASGLDVIQLLRWRHGPGLHAALVTAERSADVREAARALDVHIINKPVKPAALRALLSQFAGSRIAAE